MIDAIIAFVLGIVSVLGFQHFWPKRAQIQAQAGTEIEALGQVLEHATQALHARFDVLESDANPYFTRIKTMIEDALNELKTAADAKEAAAVAAATKPAVDAAVAADEQKVRDFTAANFAAPAA